MIRKFGIVLLPILAFLFLLLAPGPPAVAQDAWRERQEREQVVAAYGPVTRNMVEAYGDSAVRALSSCSRPVAWRLAQFHNDGRLNRIAKGHEVLYAIAHNGGDAIAWWVINNGTVLEDLDAVEAFNADAAGIALGVRSLDSGIARVRAARLAAANPPSVNFFDKRLVGVAGGVLLVIGGFIYWRRRRQAVVPGAA